MSEEFSNITSINPALSENIRDAVPVIRNLVAIYQQARASGKKESALWADYALHWAVRGLEVYLPRVMVSRKAAAKAKAMGIDDLGIYKWDDQKAMGKMRDPKRRIFHYEHVWPVATLRRELESLETLTDEAVLAIISKICVAWITKEEAKALGPHGRENDDIPHVEKIARQIPFMP